MPAAVLKNVSRAEKVSLEKMAGVIKDSVFAHREVGA
jgi:hypothetical protein